MFNLERHAFLAGCYKTFGFGAYPCSLCETCLPEWGDIDFHTVKRLCRHPDRLRPSMEASGIDVYATVRAAGFELEVVRIVCRDDQDIWAGTASVARTQI